MSLCVRSDSFSINKSRPSIFYIHSYILCLVFYEGDDVVENDQKEGRKRKAMMVARMEEIGGARSTTNKETRHRISRHRTSSSRPALAPFPPSSTHSHPKQTKEKKKKETKGKIPFHSSSTHTHHIHNVSWRPKAHDRASSRRGRTFASRVISPSSPLSSSFLSDSQPPSGTNGSDLGPGLICSGQDKQHQHRAFCLDG